MNAIAQEFQRPTVRVRSEAFLSSGAIPKRHTGEDKDISPSIRWDQVPENTAELALICDDPDASVGKPWVHWVIYKISPDEIGIPEGIQTIAKPEEPFGALQGKNSWGTTGYKGPLPAKGSGRHRFHFKLYALDKELNLAADIDKEALIKAMSGHVIATGELVGIYER